MTERVAGESRARDDRVGTTLDVLRFEAAGRIRMTGIIAVLLSLFGGLYLWIGPQVVTEMDMTAMVESLPPTLAALFGFESLASLEGLLASEFYTFGWTVGLACYVVYTAAGSIAEDIRLGRMDMLLSAPVARRDVLLGKFLALLVPVVAVNVAVPLALFAGAHLVGDPLSLVDLAALHGAAVVYLLFWGALGLLLGLVVRGGRTAGRVGLAIVFAAWLFESILMGTEYRRLGDLSPVHYFDPAAVLIHGRYDPMGVGLLAAGTVVLFVFGLWLFERTDV